MKTRQILWSLTACALVLAACAQQMAGPGGNDLAGTVTGANGPEAGVWVVAETRDLPTRYAKIVVTDERGRYLIPDLPKASYSVWVRGYGLTDSGKLNAAPGTVLDFKVSPAASAAAAAQNYPAIYWYALLKVPPANEFPVGKVKDQPEWLNVVKSGGCNACHAMGTPGTRNMPKDFSHMNSKEAWARRIQSGQAMTQMARDISRLDSPRALALFADWTDRIAAGELPFAQPQRPQGVERNVVLTLWDWSTPTGYLHDLIGTDRRNPTLFPNGRFYGSTEDSTDNFPVLDPLASTATRVKHPVRDPRTHSSKADPMQPSPYWGEQPPWDSQTSLHNPMMDEQGRVWFTARVRPFENPAFCRKGSSHPSAKVFPMDRATRHLSMYDPKTGKFSLISTCFPTHHLVFAEDANHTLWTSSGVGGNGVVGWLNRKLYEETGDEERAQGWTPFVLDTNGNGRRDAYTEPGQSADPAKDRRLAINIYAVAVSPKDGSVWGTMLGFPMPGFVVRVNPGPNPSETAITEVYEPPLPGYGPRGGDIDRNGVYWVSLSSGHLGRFDRSQCKGPLNGPKATGKHCPEGWTLYAFPGPQFRDVKENGSAEASYYVWVDQFNTFGLGRNVPIASGNLNGSLLALVDGKWVNLQVPFPQGFFTKWVEGRIDDANGGWKGRSLWTTYSTRAMFHLEGGKENRPKVVRFQLRPDPLAR
ncbi:MAG TPA: carboxypeptidase-like regulatory domain-containing protein [Burkholderiales bacterium]|nr:carboxypeptidase-like regulatory domain-containing protein [Burkholderiales bacterium]